MVAVLGKRQHVQHPANAQLADRLDAHADRVAEKDDNPYHILAYRRGAETLRNLERPATIILEEQGRSGLEQLPGIGKSLSRRIERIIEETSRTRHGSDNAERQLMTIGCIGPQLASRIHEQLGITTLAEVLAAAFDGRLARVPGIGLKRLRAVHEALAARVSQTSRWPRETTYQQRRVTLDEPAVKTLLDIVREYRRLAALGKLPKTAPNQRNPTGDAWLPVLHTKDNGEQYTVFYSNTAHAHELGATRDWVVIHREKPRHGQWTIVTSQFGSLRGRRVVCSRTRECSEFYHGDC